MKERLVICNEEDTGGRVRVTMDEKQVLHNYQLLVGEGRKREELGVVGMGGKREEWERE